jgi:hypothetical protein
VTGPAPHHTEHYQSSGLEEGSFAADAADNGDQLLCLTNTDIDTEVTLGFAFRADSDIVGGVGGDLVATEENVKSMIAVANELTQGLDMLADHQVFDPLTHWIAMSDFLGTFVFETLVSMLSQLHFLLPP